MSEPEYDTPRSSPRVEINLPARLHSEDQVVDVETVNMSADGLLVKGDNLDEEAEYEIEINLPDVGWQRLEAEVVRSYQDGGQLAARFAGAATSGRREVIRAFLDRYLG